MDRVYRLYALSIAMKMKSANNATPQATPATNPTEKWRKTWSEFQRALRSAKDPFNPFVWIYRLGLAGLEYLYFQSRLHVVVEKYQLNKVWAPLIPLFALGLISFVILLYFLSIRKMVQQRWCGEKSSLECIWIRFHDAMVVYFGLMVFYYYLKTNLSSPGVALPKVKIKEWSCWEKQGGFFGSRGYPKIDADAEQARVALYDPPNDLLLKEEDSSKDTPKSETKYSGQKANNESIEQSKKQDSSSVTMIFPSTDSSFCKTCQITRPPRCHHCKSCNRCVLQWDHHCHYVNNCIGYNNYRSFVLLLLYITMGCWYGLAVLIVPFYELIRQEQERQAVEPSNLFQDVEQKAMGALEKMYIFYHQSQFFCDIPRTPWGMMQLVMFSEEGFPPTLGVKLVYPLLLGIGVTMTFFLGLHIKYIVKARTTLEHKIILEMTYKNLVQKYSVSAETVSVAKTASAEDFVRNPFDQGWRKNIRQIMGPSLLDLFLPGDIEPPPPFVPMDTMTDALSDTKKTQ